MSRVVAVVPDLMFGSKVAAMLEAAGHSVVLVGSPADVAPGADVVVADLAGGDVSADDAAAAARSAGARSLAVCSHVDVESRRAASAAGFDVVVPRSRFVREGSSLVARLAGGGGAPRGT